MIFFFYLMDFIFVCLIEIVVIFVWLDEFDVLNVCIIGVFIDIIYLYFVWMNILIKEGGIGRLNYLFVVDMNY